MAVLDRASVRVSTWVGGEGKPRANLWFLVGLGVLGIAGFFVYSGDGAVQIWSGVSGVVALGLALARVMLNRRRVDQG